MVRLTWDGWNDTLLRYGGDPGATPGDTDPPSPDEIIEMVADAHANLKADRQSLLDEIERQADIIKAVEEHYGG